MKRRGEKGRIVFLQSPPVTRGERRLVFYVLCGREKGSNVKSKEKEPWK